MNYKTLACFVKKPRTK